MVENVLRDMILELVMDWFEILRVYLGLAFDEKYAENYSNRICRTHSTNNYAPRHSMRASCEIDPQAELRDALVENLSTFGLAIKAKLLDPKRADEAIDEVANLLKMQFVVQWPKNTIASVSALRYEELLELEDDSLYGTPKRRAMAQAILGDVQK
jgi:hypothetical protein